jgi:hypothetical protein
VASGATGGGTGHTLKDAAGTSLGEIIGIAVGFSPATYAVLWDGGLYGYGIDGLFVTDEVVYLSADCSGTPIYPYGTGMPSPARIARYQGHTRFVTGVVGSPSTPAAFKATSTPILAEQALYAIDFGSGTCHQYSTPSADFWGVELEQVPVPPSPVQQPLTVS